MTPHRILFLNMNKHFSGYMHGSVLTRDVYACDLRTVTPAPAMRECYESLMKRLKTLEETPGTPRREVRNMAAALGLEFGRELQKQGLTFLFLPKIDR